MRINISLHFEDHTSRVINASLALKKLFQEYFSEISVRLLEFNRIQSRALLHDENHRKLLNEQKKLYLIHQKVKSL